MATPASSTPDVGAWLTPTLTSNPGLASDVATAPGNQVDNATVLSHASNVINATSAVQDHIKTQGSQGFWSGLLADGGRGLTRIVGDVQTPLNWVGHGLQSGISAIDKTQIGHATFSSLSFLGKPLQEVQKDYKFIHAIYADHGVLPGLLATLGVAGGVVGGAMLGGGIGGAAGGDIAASIIRSALGEKYADSAAKANDPKYQISFGRDFSNLLGNIAEQAGAQGVGEALEHTNKGIGKFVSGTADAVGDYTADPIMILSKANAAIKAGRFLNPTVAGNSFVLQAKYPLANVIPGVKDFLEAHSMRTFSPEQMDAVRNGGATNIQSNGYNRALDMMADLGKQANNAKLQVKGSTPADLAAGSIAFHFAGLGTDTAGRIAAITTQDLPKQEITDQIHDFLKTNVYFNELNGNLAGAAILPSRTVLNPSQSVMDAIRNNPGAIGSIYKTFTGYMPFSVDPVAQKMSTESFRWNSRDSASVIYRISRFGQNSHQYGLEMAGQYATAIAKGGADGLAQARLINAQSTFDALKSMGLPDNHFLVTKVKKTIDELNGEKDAGLGIYGVAPSERGSNISDYVTLEGKHANAAIGGWQSSQMLPIPDFLVAKRALRDLGKIGGLDLGGVAKGTGILDDFVADYYTNKIFKPLALATAGFGIRVAASELLLAVSRYGPAKVLQAKIAASAAKAGTKLIPGEEHNFVSAVLTGLGAANGVPLNLSKEVYPAFQYAKAKAMKFAAGLTADEQLDVASRLVANHGADVISPVVSSGHADVPVDSYESQQQVHNIFQKQKNNLALRDGKTYTTFTQDSKDFLGRMSTNLAHWKDEAMGKNIAQDISNVFAKKTVINPSESDKEYMGLRKKLVDNETQRILDTKAGLYDPYKHEMNANTRWVDQDPREFAADRVDTILGLGIGSDGTVNHNIFNGLANNQSPTINELKKMSKESLPAEVAGKIFEPYMDSNSLFNRVISGGFKKVFNPIINNLAREPLYVLHVGEEYGSMKYAISQGTLTPEQAFTIAETRAAHAMIPQIHNTMLKTQFAVMARNFLPFYFAQEQALKRAFLAMKDTSVLSPVFSNTVRTYQIVEHLMSNPAFVTKDPNGNSYVNIPVVGGWGEAAQAALAHFNVPMVSGLPLSVSGNLSSLKSVLPDMNKLPGVSPFIAVGGNLIADWFPGLAPTIDSALGQSAGRGFWDTVNPNGMLKSVWAAIGIDEKNQALHNALIGAMVSAYYHNDPGFNPQATSTDTEALINRVKNNARSILIMKAALNMLSPLAPKVEQVDLGLREDFLKILKAKGNYPEALLELFKQHGDSALSYTIAKSYASVPGATIPSVTSSIQWLQDHASIVKDAKTSTGALYLIPQETSKNNQDIAVYQDLLRQHLITIRTPEQFMNQLYISAGYQAFTPYKKIHDERVKTMTALQDTVGLADEANKWSGLMDKMKSLYPSWYKIYSPNASQANAAVALSQFKTIFGRPDAPTNEQAKQVQGLVNDYDTHHARMIDYKQFGDNTVVKTEKDNWTGYLQNLEKNDPRLKSVINSVFMRLD